MNLFVETLAGYIKQEWDLALTSEGGPKEARLIVQSLDPDTVFALFSELEAHRAEWLNRGRIDCHFRVATGLWRDWCRISRDAEATFKAKPQWIDKEDRLTAYRNIIRPTDRDGLVVVLVGLNHASDQGGLSGFHQVDERRIWQQMGQTFLPWVQKILKRLALPATENETQGLDDFIHQLFTVQPLQLAKLADFLEREVIGEGADLYSMGDLIDRFHAKLPFWGLPPLLTPSSGLKRAAGLLKDAATFISHQRFKSGTEQKKAWKKLDDAFTEGRLDLPLTLDEADEYQDLDAFKNTLQDFIFKADTKARARLLQTDLTPVLDVLRKKETKEKGTSTKVPRLSGLSLEVLLQAVWMTLKDFQKKHPTPALFETLDAVRIEVLSFNHDLQDDDEAGLGGETLARALLKGCLGGLVEVVEQMDWRLPVDSDQIDDLREHWETSIPLTLALDLDAIKLGKSRARPYVHFKVHIEAEGGERTFSRPYQWAFGPTHPERVRFQSACTVRELWKSGEAASPLLPVFRLPAVNMTALYYAADEEEANRLVSQALSDLSLVDLLDGLPEDCLAYDLRQATKGLAARYREWLDAYVTQGYYQANQHYFLPLRACYLDLVERVLDVHVVGSAELLRRLYKAFLLVGDGMVPNHGFLGSAVAWGISPPVMELIHARTKFLCDGFPEVASELALGREAEASFEQLLNLAEIHRPLAGLVVNAELKLSAEIKSFGLLHHLGEAPDVEKSLAVQTLLREEGSDDDENVTESIRPREESEIVARVLNDYLQLYPFAEDGLRILALHVEELSIILSGVDRFLRDYLKRTSADWPAFHCEVTVYTTSSSPMAMENRLMAWRDDLMARYRERGRPLVLAVGHRFAPSREKMAELVEQEQRLYDLAFLFRFLAGELAGEVEPASPVEFDFNSNNISPFPVCEYPRPIQRGDPWRRQSLLSNRRLHIQTRHADLSARLRHPQDTNADHLIFGRINFESWCPLLECLHRKAQWVACIDPFVDKRLLRTAERQSRRQIVGFTSGLGAYGELNLSISTEQDTLEQLAELVRAELIELLPFQDAGGFSAMASSVVGESEEIIGLSALRAVVGEGERIRELVGFAAIRRLLATPDAWMSQLLPMDSLLHWFAGSDSVHRPDLLQLSLLPRDGDVPLVKAMVIECKFAHQNPEHLSKATMQVQDGLSHLTQLLTPNRCDIQRVTFDRRYWWAQLQRAMTSRTLVNLSEHDWRKLDKALEQLAEGYFEIAWQGAVFTFWTNAEGPTPTLTPLPLPAGVIEAPLQLPDGFAIWHVALGHDGVMALFDADKTPDRLVLDETAVHVGPAVGAVRPPIERVEPVSREEEAEEAGSAPVVVAPSPKPVDPKPETVDEGRVEPDPDPSPPIVESTVKPTPMIEPLPLATPTVPEKLLIGTRTNGEPVYWHYGHANLANRHLLLFGASGSGKTYGIQCLLAEMAAQRLHSLIIDYTDGFLPQQVEALFDVAAKPKNHFVVTDKLPLNPFRQQEYTLDPSIPRIKESPYQVASRVASIFISVYESIGDQQKAALMRSLEEGISGDSQFTFDKLLNRLRDDSQYGESLASKLEPLIKSQPFREGEESAWEDMLSGHDHLVHVLQLKGLGRDVQKLVTEFALWDLYDFACNNGSKNRPIPIVLDEIQNLDHSSDSPIDKMLREGRKFGLSLLLATQTTSQFDQEGRDRLFQAGHKLFFKPADTEIERFATLLSQTTSEPKADWRQRLSNLQKGQCWSLGPVLTSAGKLQEKALLVRVTALEQRQLGTP
ncbi:ATP-binding protein [Thiorhodococcus mannitoliphagus]|uniref:ATP-binding protein n=1 Tax=Thiorhodococcus mannitoliphagus TaxID=329406 RepID=A0A6P1DSJ9_9GAMM|nr:ATP-binding protein [Thiorhodococcus mannitoliphagus]NEX21267.1 ATP-binding protein [Thiorhodococcus mannitoliphagus]